MKKFIHYAHQELEITEDEYVQYCKTWLHVNQVTTVTSDNKLKFNFPDLRVHLIKILRDYLSEKTFTERLSLKECGYAEKLRAKTGGTKREAKRGARS